MKKFDTVKHLLKKEWGADLHDKGECFKPNYCVAVQLRGYRHIRFRSLKRILEYFELVVE